jgi:hypothetical protein
MLRNQPLNRPMEDFYNRALPALQGASVAVAVAPATVSAIVNRMIDQVDSSGDNVLTIQCLALAPSLVAGISGAMLSRHPEASTVGLCVATSTAAVTAISAAIIDAVFGENQEAGAAAASIVTAAVATAVASVLLDHAVTGARHAAGAVATRVGAWGGAAANWVRGAGTPPQADAPAAEELAAAIVLEIRNELGAASARLEQGAALPEQRLDDVTFHL